MAPILFYTLYAFNILRANTRRVSDVHRAVHCRTLEREGHSGHPFLEWRSRTAGIRLYLVFLQ